MAERVKTLLLRMERVKYAYQAERYVLNGIDWEIPERKKCALIGPNGCGKTTLFLHLNGLLRAQEGAVYWKGRNMYERGADWTQWRREVGIVFQNPEHQILAPLVRDELAISLVHAGIDREKMREALAAITAEYHLQSWLDRPTHQFSLGQKKWLTLCCTMAAKPDLLVLDEPTAYLDQHQTKQFLKQIDAIHQAGTTVLIATHDMDFVWQWADVVAVMHEGRIVMQGAPEDVFADRQRLLDIRLDVPLFVRLWQAWRPEEKIVPRCVAP
ncbi:MULTISPECIES: energy-coupling factor ABC transporter ATP-binding protein [Geobacillus]|jgi:cobalt/nickel transport system ATP-binding protein|uniref:ABC transporter ATP-binding protein n=1 Tax=Geobacillus thermodenitrificans TaxID=33940 RepID=A0ABY9Q6Y8_GEOTD|nr:MULTISPECIES: ABC transporter ATP-binding protein [Geobacillus]QNU25150.1 ABC transporter ATP-binding protein [Geobacillus zalihae]QNU31410.1 ABC transporter ATP-binding protein [Geobacillus sp. 47C-IIb]WMV74614.1 ABC transporter ATP-binding protein [Geobacillus thermodenitrificans]